MENNINYESALIRSATSRVNRHLSLNDGANLRARLAPNLGTPSHSWDFRNFLEHSFGLFRKNVELAHSDKLYVMKSKTLAKNPNINWYDTDVRLMDNFNKISFFKNNIRRYKEKVTELAQGTYTPEHLFGLRHVSEDITQCLLRTLYYTEGYAGVSQLRRNLIAICNNGNFDPDCLKVYNFLLYTAPFMFSDLYHNSTLLTPDMFFHCPYEIIAVNLDSYISSIQFQDLNLVLRLQLKLECNYLPDVGYYKDMYYSIAAASQMYRLYTTRGFVYGTLMATIPFGIRLGASLLTNTSSPELLTNEVDILISMINDIIHLV